MNAALNQVLQQDYQIFTMKTLIVMILLEAVIEDMSSLDSIIEQILIDDYIIDALDEAQSETK